MKPKVSCIKSSLRVASLSLCLLSLVSLTGCTQISYGFKQGQEHRDAASFWFNVQKGQQNETTDGLWLSAQLGHQNGTSGTLWDNVRRGWQKDVHRVMTP